MSPDSQPRPPAEILSLLRAHAAGTAGDDALHDIRARPLAGGHRNAVYELTSSNSPVAVKIYKKDDRLLDKREWLSLTLLCEHRPGTAPRPLWTDPRPQQPATGMTIIPGHACPAEADQPTYAGAIVTTVLELAELPLHGGLSLMPRAKGPAHYTRSLTSKWHSELTGRPQDALTRDLLRLFSQWADGEDAKTLTALTPRTFSHGDGNIDNWLWDGQQLRCIDFEFAGWSDIAFDLADIVEHVSARAISDNAWEAAIDRADLHGSAQSRYAAGSRTCALRWLAALWRQREQRANEFETQLDRTRSLIQHLR
jgi:Phosphotransferase enzyme family